MTPKGGNDLSELWLVSRPCFACAKMNLNKEARVGEAVAKESLLSASSLITTPGMVGIANCCFPHLAHQFKNLMVESARFNLDSANIWTL
jgi:hypothetical protein